MERDNKGRFVKGHTPLLIDYSKGSKWYNNNKKNFFQIGNKIRNTGRTRFKPNQVSLRKGQKNKPNSKETILKRIETRKKNGWWKNSELTKAKMSDSQKGEKGNNWKGGITSINRSYRKSYKWNIWRDQIFKRDNYTCQSCGIRNEKELGTSIYLHPHHIVPISKCLEQKLDLIFDINNGITLCKDCHQKKHIGKNHGME